jgi:hypothetical protein
VHEGPRPTEEEHELAHTDRLDEEEDMRGGQAPRHADEDADANED